MEQEEFVRLIKNSSNQEILSYFETNNLSLSLISGILFDYSFRYKGNFLHYCCYTLSRNEIVLPLMEICDRKGLHLTELMKQPDKPYRRMALHYAAWRGLTEVIRYMIQKLSDHDLLKKEDHFGWSILHWATFRNQREIVELVLNSRGYLHWNQIRDKKGKTIVGLAEQYGFDDLAAIISETDIRRSQQQQQQPTVRVISDRENVTEQIRPIEIRNHPDTQPEKEKVEDEQRGAESRGREGEGEEEEEGDGEGEAEGVEEEDIEEQSLEVIEKLRAEIVMNKQRMNLLEKENQSQKEEIEAMKERERARRAEIEQLLQRIKELEGV